MSVTPKPYTVTVTASTRFATDLILNDTAAQAIADEHARTFRVRRVSPVDVTSHRLTTPPLEFGRTFDVVDVHLTFEAVPVDTEPQPLSWADRTVFFVLAALLAVMLTWRLIETWSTASTVMSAARIAAAIGSVAIMALTRPRRSR